MAAVEGASPPPARLPRRNPARGGDEGGGEGGRAPLFKLVSFPRQRPRLGLLCAGVCPDRPTHPTSLLGGWGRLLKGSEWGSGARGLGPRRGRGWGRGALCRRVSHVRPTYSPTPTGSRAAGPWGQPEPRLARGGDRGAQTTPPCLPSALRALA